MLFLLVDGIIKLARIKAVTDSMPKFGWPVGLAVPLGILLLSCLALYVVPRTAALGAILLTGYLGAPSPRTCALVIHSSRMSSSPSTSV